MALGQKSQQLLSLLAESERERRQANLAGDLYQASLIAAGESPIQAQLQADQLRQQETGLDEETRFERMKSLMDPLGKISEERVQQYGNLIKDAGTAKRRAFEKYLETLKGVASARSGPAAAQTRAAVKRLELQLKQLDRLIESDEKPSKQTQELAKNIIRASKGETGETGARSGEEFGEVVAQKLDDILLRDANAEKQNQPRLLTPGQRKHLISALRPAMGRRATAGSLIQNNQGQNISREAIYQRSIQQDQSGDIPQAKQDRERLLDEAPQRFSRYGVGGSGIIKKAQQEFENSSEDYRKAIADFRKEVPPENVFGQTVYEKFAIPQLEALQKAPPKELPSIRIGKELMKQEDVQRATNGDPTKLRSLLQTFERQQRKQKRMPLFGQKTKKLKTPAPPSSVYGSERQVALEETEVPDGGAGSADNSPY
jgi:hypothetical protein